jgi:dipeptidyl aminopeptidase/acylaminoacyl peptidase
MLRLLKAGIEFVCAAYRGSDGFGTEHREANLGEFGRMDMFDLLAVGRDWKYRFGEGRRQVIVGYSYGGFLTLLALEQEDIPWIGGIALWPLTSLLHFPSHLPHALPPDPIQQEAELIKRSPLHWPEKMRVPLLVFHGGLDVVATTEELVTFQKKVQDQGGICDLYVYEDDTHGLMRHRDEIHRIILEMIHN